MSTVMVYALTNDRAQEAVERLIQHFAIRRTECADEYEFPQFADVPDCVYADDQSILRRLESEKNAEYSLYWNVTESHARLPVRQVVAIYTRDGGVILGIEVPEAYAPTALEEYQQSLGLKWAVITGEEYPADSASQFQELCGRATLRRIQDGKLLE